MLWVAIRWEEDNRREENGSQYEYDEVSQRGQIDLHIDDDRERQLRRDKEDSRELLNYIPSLHSSIHLSDHEIDSDLPMEVSTTAARGRHRPTRQVRHDTGKRDRRKYNLLRRCSIET